MCVAIAARPTDSQFAEADRIIDGVALPDADIEASPLMTRSAPMDEDGLTPSAIRAIVMCVAVCPWPV